LTDDEFDTMCVIEYMVFANLKAIQNEEEFEDYIFEETQRIARRVWQRRKKNDRQS
jgi:N-acetyl-beta-hexosaminidase